MVRPPSILSHFPPVPCPMGGHFFRIIPPIAIQVDMPLLMAIPTEGSEVVGRLTAENDFRLLIVPNLITQMMHLQGAPLVTVLATATTALEDRPPRGLGDRPLAAALVPSADGMFLSPADILKGHFTRHTYPPRQKGRFFKTANHPGQHPGRGTGPRIPHAAHRGCETTAQVLRFRESP